MYYGESKNKKLFRKSNKKIKSVVNSKKANLVFLEKSNINNTSKDTQNGKSLIGNSGNDKNKSSIQTTKKDNEKEEDSDDEWESDESDEESDENEVSNGIGPTKMVLAVRMDLKMGKGKIAAQCGHASVSAFKKAKLKSPELVKAWEYEGSRKIAVKVKDEDDL